MTYSRYSYKGSVTIFYSQLAERCWEGQTYAPSESKALSNLKYQYRKLMGLSYNTPIDLDGKLIKN